MLYATVFIAATLAALLLMQVVPARSRTLVKARLGALDVGGPEVPERAQQILERRRAKARQLQLRQGLRRGSRMAALAATTVLLLALGARSWGLLPALVGGLAIALCALGGNQVWRLWRGRRVAFQLPEAVKLLADRLQESNSLDQALEYVGQAGPRAAARELGRVRRALRTGQTEERAFGQFARRNPSAEAEMLVSCLALPQERGRRLAESLRPLQALLDSRIQLAKRQARRARRLSWALFVPVSAAMVVAGSSGSFLVLAGWTCFAIGTLLIAWVGAAQGGLA